MINMIGKIFIAGMIGGLAGKAGFQIASLSYWGLIVLMIVSLFMVEFKE
jgi:hypothetical protein